MMQVKTKLNTQCVLRRRKNNVLSPSHFPMFFALSRFKQNAMYVCMSWIMTSLAILQCIFHNTNRNATPYMEARVNSNKPTAECYVWLYMWYHYFFHCVFHIERYSDTTKYLFTCFMSVHRSRLNRENNFFKFLQTKNF